jgi:hypothetical protein
LPSSRSLHNNHHAHPQAPPFSARFGEFDPSWLLIRALGGAGLVTIGRSAAKARVDMRRRVAGESDETLAAPALAGARSEDLVEG